MMANSLFKLILVLIFLNSCSQPKTKREKKEIELEEVFEKSSSTSLFQNDQKRLTQFTSRDERSKDSSLDTLLKTVERAIRKEDLNLLLTLMDQEIVSSYGGGLIGHDDFLMNWERDYKKMWDKLSKILTLGGTFTHPGKLHHSGRRRRASRSNQIRRNDCSSWLRHYHQLENKALPELKMR